MPDSMNPAIRVAYLTSRYPATSHTFIRREIAAVRGVGVRVDTFSVRAPSAAELTAADDRHEAEATYTILDRPLREFLTAHLAEFASRPATYARTLALALRHRAPGLKNALLALAHFGEGILLARELRRRGIAHLHNHFANSGATVGLLASRQAETGWSFTIHGISEFDYPAGLMLPEKIAAARFVACVSYFGKAQASRLIDSSLWPKLTIVRCGLELDRLPQRERAADAMARFIFVGRLSAEKGIAGLLDALARMTTRPRPRLSIVGDGPLSGDLKAQVSALGLDDSVEFLGRLPEAETLSAIARSNVLVLPSFIEGLPVVLMEALGLGVSVIASRVAGIPELVEEGQTGLLFAPSNWDELTEALDRLASDPTLRRRLGAAGPARVAEEFDIRTSALRLRRLFQGGDRSAPTPTAPLS
jgi:colanic acid/amylovoran biosynthesis glycosyltransferase